MALPYMHLNKVPLSFVQYVTGGLSIPHGFFGLKIFEDPSCNVNKTFKLLNYYRSVF